MTTATTRPCWHCGTQHQSDTMPALCSDPCVAAWQQDYQLQYGEPMQHTNHGCNPEPVPLRVADEREPSTLDDQDQAVLDELGNQALRQRAPQLVLDLHRAGHLGYIAASDEWIEQHGAPLIEPLQEAADTLARAGLLPEFAEWFPAPSDDNRDFAARPADEPQDLVDDAGRYGGTVGSLIGARIPECPPRPPEPPVAFAEPDGPLLARLLGALRRWRA